MVKTSTKKRSRRHRAKLRENEELHALVKDKDRKRKAAQRRAAKQKMTEADIVKQRKYERERKKIQRQQQKMQDQGTPSEPVEYQPYGSKQILGKTVHRVKKNLPNSPKKVVKVVSELVRTMTPNSKNTVAKSLRSSSGVRKRLIGMEERQKRSDALSDLDIQKVHDFYAQDDISRMCPGKKEFISVKTDGGRVHMQKRLLLFNLGEVHRLFVAETGMNISRSKCCELRPKHIVPMSVGDQDVCLCRYHENVNMMVASLNKVVPRLPVSADDVLMATVCSMEKEEYVNRQCPTCGTDSLDELFSSTDDIPVTFYQLTYVDGRIQKQPETKSLYDALTDLKSQLKPFARHVYDARRQHAEMKHLKKNIMPGEIILHEDFSENYTLKHQHEIMQAHWSTESVTVFTAIVFYRPEEHAELMHVSYSVVSDTLNHDKSAVVSFNRAILDDVQHKLPFKISQVHYWSDGTGSQFKNKYMFANLLHHEEQFGFNADWSFFATAHGKGPIDGIGGEVKRCVWRAVLQDRIVVNTVEEFYSAAKDLCRKITVLYVDKEEIEKTAETLQDLWSRTITIPGTLKLHYLRPSGKPGHIEHGRNSPFRAGKGNLQLARVQSVNSYDTQAGGEQINAVIEPQQGSNQERHPEAMLPAIQSTSETYHHGDFLLVGLSTGRSRKVFLGQVVALDNTNQGELHISFLRAADMEKQIFVVFPHREDTSWIFRSEVMRKLPVPNVNNRGHYKFPEPLPVSE